MIYSRLLRGGIWEITIRSLGIGVLFGTHVILAKFLQPEELGAYFIITGILSLFVLLNIFGLSIVAINRIAGYRATKEEHKIRPVILTLLHFTLLNGLIISVFFYVFIGESIFHNIFNLDISSPTMFYITLNIVAGALISLIVACHRGFHDIPRASFFAVLMPQTLFFLALLIYLVNSETLGIGDVFLYFLLARIITILVSAMALRSKLSPDSGNNSSESLSSLLVVCTPIVIIHSVSLANQQGALWLAGFFFDANAAAIYGVALKVFGVTMLIYSVVSSVMWPTLVELYEQRNLDGAQSLSQVMASIVSVFAIISFILFVLLGESMLALVFGDVYVQAYGLLVVVSLFYVIQLYFGFASEILFITGHEKALLVITFSTSLIRILLAVAMIESMELYGIVLAWGIGSVLQQAWCWCRVKSLTKIKCHASYQYKAIEDTSS